MQSALCLLYRLLLGIDSRPYDHRDVRLAVVGLADDRHTSRLVPELADLAAAQADSLVRHRRPRHRHTGVGTAFLPTDIR